ncbi:MAG: hypothetical protein K6E29_08385 [Cyanobacteria bacterium RUI128]|nr:hypothetical protein [Cyanobacteria bacterium RUI128]
MKKREEEKPSYAKLFIGAFLIMMVFFVIVATHLTSSVDTTIGENDEGDIKESGLGVKHLIDSRLRFIQMEDASGPATSKKDEPATIQQYDKTIEEKKDNNYSGKYQNSYGYETTQETKPYSQTYSNAQKQYNSYSAGSTGSSTSNTTSAARTYTVPTPQTPAKPAPAALKPVTPAHNIQKNLTPTGMN